MLKHEKDRITFLNILEDGGEFSFRTFDDTGKSRKELLSYPDHRGTIAKVRGKLERVNKMGAGVFVMVNDGKQIDKHVNNIRACFVDMDSDKASASVDKAMKKNPHIVVHSSFGRFHAYWKVHGFRMEKEGIRCPEFRQVQNNLIYNLDGDPQVKNESRVMRMPGFYHNKCKHGSKPFMTEVIYSSNHRPFSYAEMVSLFPPEKVKMYSAQKYERKYESDGDFKGEYGTSEGGRNNWIFKRGCGAKARGVDFIREIHLENDACSPPLEDREVEAIIRQVSAMQC